jgi:hypothetical protein
MEHPDDGGADAMCGARYQSNLSRQCGVIFCHGISPSFDTLVPIQKQYRPSFWRRPESSKLLNSLDPGLRQDDAVSK